MAAAYCAGYTVAIVLCEFVYVNLYDVFLQGGSSRGVSLTAYVVISLLENSDVIKSLEQVGLLNSYGLQIM